jgi:uncharacterized protein
MIILDTNTLISAMLFPGKEAQLLKKILLSDVLIFSHETAKEFLEVSMRPKFQKYLDYETRYIFSLTLVAKSRQIIPTVSCDICRDPTDNKFLEVALTAVPQFLITGDQDLLILGKIGKTKILTAKDFLTQKQTYKNTHLKGGGRG